MNQKSIHTVYVLNKDGKPLMPTRPAKAKWLLKNGKAKVVRRSLCWLRQHWTTNKSFALYHPTDLPD